MLRRTNDTGKKSAVECGTGDKEEARVVDYSASEKSTLPTFESWIYWAGYIGLIIYATYRVYIASNDYTHELLPYYFKPGWKMIGKKIDNANYEWSFWFMWFSKHWPWIIGHISLSVLLQFTFPQVIQPFYLLYGLVAVSSIMGWSALVILLIHCLTMYGAAILSQSRIVVWIIAIMLLSTLNFDLFTGYMKALYPDDDNMERQFYLLVFATAMVNLRYLSFCMEACSTPVEGQQSPSSSLRDMLIYCFYFPTFFMGPVITYDTFSKQINSPPKPWTTDRGFLYVKEVGRLFFWFCFYEVSSHYLYYNAILANVHIMNSCSVWVIAGIAYLSGQFFMVKYVIMFGLPSLMAQFDGLSPMAGPICISRVYLYSQMWKCFDRGLYSFIKRHIYIPLGGSQFGMARQLMASMACFAFIYLWHGAEHNLLIWCILNYIGVTLEAARQVIGRLPSVTNLLLPLSPAMKRRLNVVITVPLLGLSTFGYFYFMAGSTVGQVYVDRLLVGGTVTFTVALSYYLQIQVSVDIENWERRRKLYTVKQE